MESFQGYIDMMVRQIRESHEKKEEALESRLRELKATIRDLVQKHDNLSSAYRCAQMLLPLLPLKKENEVQFPPFQQSSFMIDIFFVIILGCYGTTLKVKKQSQCHRLTKLVCTCLQRLNCRLPRLVSCCQQCFCETTESRRILPRQ